MLVKDRLEVGCTREVTFTVSPDVNAQTACLCGEFNDWGPTSHPMTRGEDGGFTLTLTLTAGRAYRYRYLFDGDRWETDWAADAYAVNPYGSVDSVVQL